MFNEVVDFIRGLYSGREVMSLHELCFRSNEKRYLEESIVSTYVSTISKFVDTLLIEDQIVNVPGSII